MPNYGSSKTYSSVSEPVSSSTPPESSAVPASSMESSGGGSTPPLPTCSYYWTGTANCLTGTFSGWTLSIVRCGQPDNDGTLTATDNGDGTITVGAWTTHIYPCSGDGTGGNDCPQPGQPGGDSITPPAMPTWDQLGKLCFPDSSSSGHCACDIAGIWDEGGLGGTATITATGPGTYAVSISGGPHDGLTGTAVCNGDGSYTITCFGCGAGVTVVGTPSSDCSTILFLAYGSSWTRN